MRREARLSSLLARLWRHLGKRRQRQLLLLMVLMVVSAVAEVISLGAVLPFIGVLAAPEAIFDRPIVAALAHRWGIDTPGELVLPLTVMFATAAIVAAALRIFSVWVTTRLTFASGADLSREIYRRTLYQPYSVHVSRSSSEIISGITSKVGGTVLGVLLPALTLLSSMILMIALFLALIAIDPLVALTATAGFGGCYGLITWLARRRLRRNGKRIAIEYTQVVKALQEGLGGIRDVLLDGTQPVYCEIYKNADSPLRRATGENIFIGQSPRFAMEALGMVMIAGLAYALSGQPGGLATALPVLGALALGAQRMLPALQQSYQAWTSILGSEASLTDTIELLDQPLPAHILQPAPAPLPLLESIRLENVRFRYGSDGPWVLDDVSLTIPKGARVGIVGGTGSGKSTALDLLMGLLTATEGNILVDGRPIGSDLMRAWQRTIAHVPQSIYLADATVAENIAFGVPRAQIDLDRVQRAARQAQVAEFVEGWPDGYQSKVGERGVRLSGGQRQRIGIARALYKQAKVLVLDEATSALDNLTEKTVMTAIESLDRELTVIIIAHRLTTVQRCDTIVELEHGRIVAQGRFAELLDRSPSFRHLADAAVR